jgi:hypothetical protein
MMLPSASILYLAGSENETRKSSLAHAPTGGEVRKVVRGK